jgi:LemA protein
MSAQALALTVGGTAAAILLWVLAAYNSLVGKRNDADNAAGGVDVQLKKRFDLIPNLLSAVKGYMAHERDLLERLAEIRSEAAKAGAARRAELAEEARGAMETVFAAVEAYPELKASANVMHLQRALAETEEQIAAARRFFNAAVTSYNDAVQSFPGSLVAGAFGFAKRDWFAADAAERARPDADFSR